MHSAVVRPHPPRGNMLKRTISKCSMDDGAAAQAPKKLSPPRACDAGDAVLLPRHHQQHNGDAFAFDEPEASPQPTFGWPEDARGSPDPADSNGGNCYGGDGDAVSALQLFGALVEYLRETVACSPAPLALSFGQLARLLQDAPFASRQLQGLVHARLALSWPRVAAVAELVVAFICDEDLREAAVGELAQFAQCCVQEPERLPMGDVAHALPELFRDALDAFKAFLTKRWLQSGRIQFPCEFGKKSDALFLCMECHREHL